MKHIIKFILPFFAGVITRLPFNYKLSLFLDRLLIISEKGQVDR